MERQPGVDDLVDDDHVSAGDLQVEILQEPDPLMASDVARPVAGELDEVERVRDRSRKREVGDEREAGLQRSDQEGLAAGVVAGELGAELANAGRDLAGTQVHIADAGVELVAHEALRRPYRDESRAKSRS